MADTFSFGGASVTCVGAGGQCDFPGGLGFGGEALPAGAYIWVVGDSWSQTFATADASINQLTLNLTLAQEPFRGAVSESPYCLYQNYGRSIAHQVNLTGFLREARGQFEPIGRIRIIAGARVKLDALQGHKNMFHAGGSRAGFADWGFDRNHAQSAVGKRKRTGWRRISCFYDDATIAIIEKANKAGITAASKPEGGEQRSTTECTPELITREPHTPDPVIRPVESGLSAMYFTPPRYPVVRHSKKSSTGRTQASTHISISPSIMSSRAFGLRILMKMGQS
jgi:hypothetical protein